MRYFFSLLFLLLFVGCASLTLGQTVNFEDGFEDGDFTDDPTWNGDTDQFIVIDGDPNHLLQLQGDDVDGDVSYLSTESTDVEGSWEFYINLNYNPSNGNRVDIFLMSDIDNLEDDVNGYAIRAGENRSDDVFRLVRYENGSQVETILSGITDISSGGSFRVRITREAGGDWTLEVGEGYDGQLSVEGSATDNTFDTKSFTGVRATYTSTRDDLFTFDYKIDLPPFTITESSAEGNQVEVNFNRPYDENTAEKYDFSVDGLGEPSTITYTDETTISLNYDNPIPSGKYTLSVDDIEDVHGETIADNATSSFVIFAEYSDGDVKINEFMADPPSGQAEYVELINTSEKYLNLADWKIGDETGTDPLGSDPIPLEPNNFIVISPDTVVLHNVYGSRPFYEFSLANLNNSGDLIELITNSGMQADSLVYESDWGGTDVALERRSASAPSTFQENWGDSPNHDGGTPGKPNEIAEDNIPPQLTGLNIVSSQILQLSFDERLNDIGNYTITNSSISSADTTGPDTVELSLGSNLENAQSYTLSVDGAEDIFGNATSADTSFTFFEITSADSGDVFINEFNFAPASGSTEFVEIYNPTSESFDLQDWTLSDNRGIRSTITDSQFTIPPEGYVVIAPDNTLLADHPDIDLVSMSGFPALNNSGDDIVIRNGEGTVLDSLRYTSEWGGNEVPLERRTTSISGTFKENWGEAPNRSGTPGTANEVDIDETPPEFEELWAEDATTFKLLFSENIEPSSATKSQKYEISPTRGIQLISARNDTVTLFLDEELSSGESYAVTVSNIPDIFGNIMSEATRETEFLRIERAQTGDIVINEILYNPGTNDADFVELYNTSDKNFDLSNWTINDASGGATISQTLQLESGEFLVLTGSRPFARQSDNAYETDGFPSLNNNIPDDIYLQTQDGRTIDSLRYEQSWGANIEGTSLERKDPRRASNDASNWQTSAAESGYSAGTQNASFQDDNNPPELIFSKIVPDGNIEVQFSEFIKLTDDVRFLAGDQQLQVIQFDSTRANIVVLSSGAAKSKVSNSNSISVQNLSDVKGNIASSSEVPVSQPLALADLVINEIMFNPLAESDDNRPDQSEYIELRNTRDYAISLEGLVLHDEPDENGEVRELVPVSTTAKWISSQGQVLIHADAAPAFEESQVANFFELEAPDMRSIMRVDRTTLSLASTGDAIFIADSTGATIDSVFYSEEWHNPNIIDTRGIALERVTPDGPSDDESNWGSSVNEKGGTPNSENSIYQENANLPQETGISFTPNPFSPDSDGYEDNLFINYKLDHQDYLIDVKIYDRYGRLVRELADGKQAGFEGQLIWDGRKNDNSRNRIGIYIVVFEAYDSTSGGDQNFKETVVLARMLN